MISIEITQEQIQASFQKTLNNMLEPTVHNNPVKVVLEELLPRSYKPDTAVGIQIKNYLLQLVEDENFKLEIRRAAANIFAQKMLEASEKK